MLTNAVYPQNRRDVHTAGLSGQKKCLNGRFFSLSSINIQEKIVFYMKKRKNFQQIRIYSIISCIFGAI